MGIASTLIIVRVASGTAIESEVSFREIVLNYRDGTTPEESAIGEVLDIGGPNPGPDNNDEVCAGDHLNDSFSMILKQRHTQTKYQNSSASHEE
ncbi:hypothetical protein PM082_024266 [Marasmius tenuissimus]|nr:hypothetical protein PM082_024266 [Marasmius tenuissimus]